jgi:hypothetical protein
VKLRTAAFSGQQLSLHSSFPSTASHRQPKQTGPKSLQTLHGMKRKAQMGTQLLLSYCEVLGNHNKNHGFINEQGLGAAAEGELTKLRTEFELCFRYAK